MATEINFPEVKNPELVGTYAALTEVGFGYVCDAVLEYRVWCHPHDGAEDLEDGDDYYYSFESFEKAHTFASQTTGAGEPVALVLQEEYISEPEPRQYVHIKEQRITEWSIGFLSRPRITSNSIPDFMSPNAPWLKIIINKLFNYINSLIPDDVPKPWVIGIFIWMAGGFIMCLLVLLKIMGHTGFYKLFFPILLLIAISFFICVIWFLYDYFTGGNNTWR